MVRPRSESNLASLEAKKSPKRSIYPPIEPGVDSFDHGVRPNMEESMTFLKKLFTHQQEGGGGFPSLLSPPDSPLRKFLFELIRLLLKLIANFFLLVLNNLTKTKRSSSTGQMRHLNAIENKIPASSLPHMALESNKNGGVQLGVYTLSQRRQGQEHESKNELESIRRICLHNASVCQKHKETEKENVWNLLAQTVESQMDDEGKTFNGWGGNGGGALGVDLISNLLKFYENLGDVQMLATMFCVLSGGRRNTNIEDGPYLLPQGQDEKYDSYIRRYAELLYGWGLLSTRAEVNKHLLRAPKSSGDMSQAANSAESGRSPGLAVVFMCPRCGRDADFNTNVCRNCQDFAFRCSICDNAVRGLFTVCDICNHGGHVEHMKSWFANQTECPTGCGCTCTFSPKMMPAPAEVVSGSGVPTIERLL